MASNVFSFYDAAEVAQSEAKVLVNTIGDAHSEESEDYDVRDEADAIVEEDEEERAIDATHSEPRTAAVSGPGTVNQFLDRANALNEIRMLLKDEIEQDSAMFTEFNDVITAQSEKIEELNNYIVQQLEEHASETGALS
eukprot:scaffold41037_cov241-Skeletonema_marinoi.AAC.2